MLDKLKGTLFSMTEYTNVDDDDDDIYDIRKANLHIVKYILLAI